MRIYSIVILRKEGNNFNIVANAEYLNDFMFFEKDSVRSFVHALGKGICNRIDGPKYESYEHEGYMCHVHIQESGLACCVTSDEEYPPRVAHSVILNCLTKYTGQDSMNDFLSSYIDEIQNPNNFDKLTEIKSNIDITRSIVISNIDQLLNRGEKLENLLQSSNDLVIGADDFNKRAQEMNSCCVIL